MGTTNYIYDENDEESSEPDVEEVTRAAVKTVDAVLRGIEAPGWEPQMVNVRAAEFIGKAPSALMVARRALTVLYDEVMALQAQLWIATESLNDAETECLGGLHRWEQGFEREFCIFCGETKPTDDGSWEPDMVDPRA